MTLPYVKMPGDKGTASVDGVDGVAQTVAVMVVESEVEPMIHNDSLLVPAQGGLRWTRSGNAGSDTSR